MGYIIELMIVNSKRSINSTKKKNKRNNTNRPTYIMHASLGGVLGTNH